MADGGGKDGAAGGWDVIVVGTGMGGGIAGRRLTELGLRVLLLEKGRAIDPTAADLDAHPEDRVERMRIGRWPDRWRTVIDGVSADLHPGVGCGLGGSTQLYAAALERMERHDVDDVAGIPHPTGGWPIAFDTLRPYYAAAERILNVHGTPVPDGDDHDEGAAPLRRPPPMREADAVLMQDMAAAGLRPYRMHVGIAYKPGCDECLGHPCLRGCKSDAVTCGVAPALAGGAETRTDADVIRLEADADRVTAVVYRDAAGIAHRVSAPVVVLAAGALSTAVLLLASRSPAWPDGLANASGGVGRNLMFHVDNWFAVWPSRKASRAGPSKTVGSRGLYRRDGLRMGMIQATGLSAGYGNILVFLYQQFDRSRWNRLRFIRPLLRIPAKIAEKLFGTATVMTMMVEDLPCADNRVELDAGDAARVTVRYRSTDELKARSQAARRLFAAAMRGRRFFWLSPDAWVNWGHPMGTCRFGRDPATSVLDGDCKAHGLANLYVVDAAFMPSGGGVNPSLTIAANALRVAELIAARVRGAAEAHSVLA